MMRLVTTVWLILLLTADVCHADSLPKGSSFIGFIEGGWRLYVVPDDAAGPRVVKTSSEPRTATYSRNRGTVAYVAADGAIHEVTLKDGRDQVLISAGGKASFIQPSYGPLGDRLLMVEMKNGNSSDTEIALVDRGGRSIKVTSQPGSQFEPGFVSERKILYSSVNCSVGCGNIIEEIWSKDLVAGVAEQLTLLNSIARQPALSADGKWVYFSSNRSGSYLIWRIPLSGGNAEQATRGEGADVDPAAGPGGILCFVRNTTGSRIVCLEGQVERVIELPAGVTQVRNLEISRW